MNMPILPEARIKDMVARGVVTSDEGARLAGAAMGVPRTGVVPVWRDPFPRFGGTPMLGLGLIAAAVAWSLHDSVIYCASGSGLHQGPAVRYDGAFDLHLVGVARSATGAAADMLVSLCASAFAAWGIARAIGRKPRLLDVAGVVFAAHLPLALLGVLFAAVPAVRVMPPIPAALMIIVPASLLALVWQVAWWVYGLRNATGLTGAALTRLVVLSALAAEVFSKLVLWGLP